MIQFGVDLVENSFDKIIDLYYCIAKIKMGRKSIPLLKLSVSAFAASVFIIVGYYFQFRVVQEPWYCSTSIKSKNLFSLLMHCT